MKIYNPILRGIHPDPSICRKDNDFYIVTSSFSAFPALPIFHSKDLAQWKCISHAISDPAYMKLDGERMSHGIWAPSIRYYQGLFYIIARNMTSGGIFYVTAENPKGPWSQPHWIDSNQFGIDPDFFFDDDGKIYLIAASPYEDCQYQNQVIIAAEFSLEKDRVIDKPWILWGGALVNAHSPEAPHIYKKDGWYYLMIAEGGTEFYHCVTISRSTDIHSRFEGYHGNPILTHRHLGEMAEITGVGHGDLVDTKNGKWYMVILGRRNNPYKYQSIGRETFIVPVAWENGWPVINPGKGIVESVVHESYGQKKDDLEIIPENEPFFDNFNENKLSDEWESLGVNENSYVIENSCLILRPKGAETYPEDRKGCKFRQKVFIYGDDNAENTERLFNFWGYPQKDFSFSVCTKLYFKPETNQCAGLVFLQNNFNQIKIQICRKNNNIWIQTVKVETYEKSSKAFVHDNVYRYDVQTLCEIKYMYETVYLKLSAHFGMWKAEFSQDGSHWNVLLDHIDGWYLGKPEKTGFIGGKAGLFCSGDPLIQTQGVIFDWFLYEPL